MPPTLASSKPAQGLMQPLPPHLRALVLDYLTHSCYTRTARKFAQETTASPQLDADGDEVMVSPTRLSSPSEETLKLADLRQKVRGCILSGKVGEATHLLHEHIPTLLSLGPSTPPPPLATSPKSLHHIEYVSSTSVQPVHISFNLQILAFIELARTIPLPDLHNQDASVATMQEESTDPIEIEAEPIARHADLLMRARKLHAMAKMLPNPKDRALYLQELENVVGLLAYKVPEHSEIGKYFSQARRESVADQVDRAILYWSGRPVISNIELGARYTTTLWSFLHDLHVDSTLLANKPAGVHWPPVKPNAVPSGKSSQSPQSSASESFPYFDLRGYLDFKA